MSDGSQQGQGEAGAGQSAEVSEGDRKMPHQQCRGGPRTEQEPGIGPSVQRGEEVAVPMTQPFRGSGPE